MPLKMLPLHSPSSRMKEPKLAVWTCCMYVTVISTLLVAAGYRLALQGNDRHSVDRAVAILRRSFPSVVVAGSAGVVELAMWEAVP